MAPVICASKCQVLLKIDFTRFGLKTLLNTQQNSKETWSRYVRRYASITPIIYDKKDSDKKDSDKKDSDKNETEKSNESKQRDVTITYIRGLPHVTVPLPSRNEKCQFALRPVSHNVGDFLQMLKSEDKGIDRAAILNDDGIRIAASCSIESLMDDEFWLHVNDKKYFVCPPQRTKLSLEEISKLGDVQTLVAQLYEALNVGEHQIKKERDLQARLEELNNQLGPLEQVKSELVVRTERKTGMLTWIGLGLMSVQFGILARLTWWEYSWDIMEPVTYFVTYGTAMAIYAYYCLTRQDYNLPDVKDRQYLISMHKKAKKRGFNIDQYNNLRRQISEIEHDLKRLRDPLYLRLSPTHNKSMFYDDNSFTLNSDTSTDKHKHSDNSITNSISNVIKRNKDKFDISDIFESATKKFKK